MMLSDDEKKAAAKAGLPEDGRVRTREQYAASAHNSWLTVTDEQPFRALHQTLRWEPFLSVGNGDGVKLIGYRRQDGAGFTLPSDGGRWWVAWQHPMGGRDTGWHHHAFGSYADATAAAMAFDVVYELERLIGNVDRCRDAVAA